MCDSVLTTPGVLEILPAITSAISSKWRTRTMAMRSTLPATEYTSLTPGSAASASATSGIESVAQSMWTIAVFTRPCYRRPGRRVVGARRPGVRAPGADGGDQTGRDQAGDRAGRLRVSPEAVRTASLRCSPGPTAAPGHNTDRTHVPATVAPAPTTERRQAPVTVASAATRLPGPAACRLAGGWSAGG